jgi:type VI secretion system protein ImpA
LNDAVSFAAALTESDPSGPNLEYDPDFLALERAQQGKPEQVMGDTVKPREEPDWPGVRERAEALLRRSRDLRLALALTAALLRIEGLAGFAAGLMLIQRLLEAQWDTVHPRLDAEDHDDPTSRVNSLVGLASPEGMLQALRETPVVFSKTLGRFGLRDIRIASGKLPVPAGMAEVPTAARIEGAFRDADLAALQATAAVAAGALDCITSIDRVLVERVGERAPELKPLVLDLAELKKFLVEKVTARGGLAAVAAEVAGPVPADGRPGTASGTGEVTSREEVVRQLDRLCEYYRRYEPSSPLPLLLQRAKRLVSKDFLEIVRDLTPSGVVEAESIRGAVKESD